MKVIVAGLLIGLDENDKLKSITLMSKRFTGIRVFYGKDRTELSKEIFEYIKNSDYVLRERDINFLKYGDDQIN